MGAKTEMSNKAKGKENVSLRQIQAVPLSSLPTAAMKVFTFLPLHFHL